MASEEILRLARSGDPTVLTGLLNHVLKPYGMTATVARHEIRLEIQLVASRPVEEPTVTQLVHRVIRQLDIPYIPTVAIAPAPDTPQHSSPEPSLPQEPQRNWTDSATHPPVAWRQEEGGISIAKSDAESDAESDESDESAEFIANPESRPEFTVSIPSQPAAVFPVSSSTSAMQTPNSQAHPDPAIDPVDMDESLNVFPPPGDPLFEPPSEEGVEAVASSTASSETASSVMPSAASSGEGHKSDLWQRPEAVIFVAYLIVVIIWQLYVDLTADAASQKSGWTATALARRLGISRTTLSRRKYQEDFSAWTQSLDPDGLAWMYVGPRFSPVLGVDVLPAAPR